MRLNVHNYRGILAQKGILDEEVRKGIGMCKTTFSQLINGELGGVTCEAMEGIAEVLGCSVGEISLSDLDEGENMIEWTRDSKTATLSISQGRIITRVKRLAEKYPDEVKIISDNQGKVLYAHIPVEWIRINPPKDLTEEQRQAIGKRLANGRA